MMTIGHFERNICIMLTVMLVLSAAGGAVCLRTQHKSDMHFFALRSNPVFCASGYSLSGTSVPKAELWIDDRTSAADSGRYRQDLCIDSETAHSPETLLWDSLHTGDNRRANVVKIYPMRI